MQPQLAEDHAPSGLEDIPSLPWGSHIGQLFDSADGMRAALVAYFRAGLENNERCLWVTGDPLDAVQARAALQAVLPDLPLREKRGDIEIQDTDFFYDREQPLQPARLVEGLLQRERDAVAAGYKGVRTNGNCTWVEGRHWEDFSDYENRVQEAVPGRRLICMCSYGQDSHGGKNLFDVLAHHHLIVRNGRPAQGPTPRTEPVSPKPQAKVGLQVLSDFQEDLRAIEAIAAVPTILEIVSRSTGMGFATVARVTPDRWICMAAHDEIGFGLRPGGELKVDTTLCHEVRQARDAVVIDHVAEDVAYRSHHTPATYGFQSYISMPIFLGDGIFLGNALRD
jgi:GAF domain-containing protein